MNNEKENINHRRTARIIAVASGLLFSVFGVVYLAIFQKEVMVNSNLLILLALCLMTVCIGNTNIHFHHELQAEEALRKR